MLKHFLKLILFFLIVHSCSGEPMIFTLKTSAIPELGGSVSPRIGEFEDGQKVVVRATPNKGYVLESWSGATGKSDTTSVIMNSDLEIVANFIKVKHNLTVYIIGKGTVKEDIIKSGITNSYKDQTIIELTATPSSGSKFVQWKGDMLGTTNPQQLVINKAKTVTAVFE